MRRKKRPYFTLVVFLTLLAFGLFLAWQSSDLNQSMAEYQMRREGRILYLPILSQGTCLVPTCPPPAAPAPQYPFEYPHNDPDRLLMDQHSQLKTAQARL